MTPTCIAILATSLTALAMSFYRHHLAARAEERAQELLRAAMAAQAERVRDEMEDAVEYVTVEWLQ
jgi:type II secretory pathway pseudopilin PulG